MHRVNRVFFNKIQNKKCDQKMNVRYNSKNFINVLNISEISLTQTKFNKINLKMRIEKNDKKNNIQMFEIDY